MCDFAYIELDIDARASEDRRVVKGSERRVARLTLRLPPSLRDGIGRCADKDGRSVSDWIVRALADAVAAVEGRDKPKSRG
jgi:predicted HicB family RNase H-like nuclease